ncbi:oxidoreductase [Mycobacterium intermedium]|uniref:Oxidoreductase n=1 Tax=Mycobacterium intermedium TaxID=28445 RepID=A0A1E3SD59_MYCIE|nr:molybdopterin-dependent oxidoreductase [Mycobacterium intermedium]MCV6965179.1 molybdopterin-dependent oxidoreductase [Mycobacterium intermedium]ODR00091.1 oxidoreductase [Mycobacterium intermedium]OPE47190.1 oxidoreductase [Mycobacterium intermedium]ORA99892.1 oxidoreductase [Mycobacterium intermedium]
MIAGVAAAAVALGIAQLVGIPFGARADARAAIGSVVVDLTPGPVKEWAIQTLGTMDKLFLAVVVLIVIAAIAAIAGSFETRRRPVGSVAIAAAGVLGCAAVLSRHGATALDTIPTIVGAACGVVALRWLVRRFEPVSEDSEGSDDGADDDRDARRRSLLTLGLLGIGVVSGVAGAVITRMVHSVAGDRTNFALPPPRTPATPIPPEVQPKGVALPSFITPAADFYRVDTALSTPQLSRGDWRLRIHGMVDRETTYSFADLDRFEVVESVTTLTCVSNPVGGDLISTGIWTGYRVADLLAAAGVHQDADMVLSKSIDGFTAGTPVEALTDRRAALLAIGLNGQPLPVEHGYPARLVVPGLYGYVSATKWVVDLELTRFDRAKAYWTRYGWAAKAPIKTESRIDVPKRGQRVPPGPVVFGGVAWAQNRGVRAVEVRIGDGEWQPAQLGAGYSNDTWRLWSFPWEAKTSGRQSITVRAIDNTGAVQTSDQAPPTPDGATGWHTVNFTVAEG